MQIRIVGHVSRFKYIYFFLMIRVRGPHLSEALGGCLVCLCLRPALTPTHTNLNPPASTSSTSILLPPRPQLLSTPTPPISTPDPNPLPQPFRPQQKESKVCLLLTATRFFA